MNYRETVDFLYQQLPMFQRVGKAAYKANLDNTLFLDKYFGHPHQNFKTIHVAGTNGKGSVSSMLASVLTEAGYKTGLYTSPHLLDYRERVRINGAMIPEQDVVDYVEKCKAIIEDIKPSFFELTTALAFWYFAKEKVDVAVIETGMGGRLDCTNIITPELSVITNIALDHTEFLGDTLAKIAGEKAGIIKSNVPVVIGERHPETDRVFIERAMEYGSAIVFAEDVISHFSPRHPELVSGSTQDSLQLSVSESTQNYNIQSPFFTFDISCPLSGIYQAKNINTAFAALQIIREKFSINDFAIQQGFKNVKENTGIRGRWEVLQNHPLVVCDTGHNAHGIKEVVKQIGNCKYRNLFIVIGMVNDKDIDAVLALLPKDAYYIFTQASVPRAMEAGVLARKVMGWDEYSSGDGGFSDGLSGLLRFTTEAKRDRPWGRSGGLTGEVIHEVKNAYKKALSLAGPDDMVFVGGSTFVVADLLKEL
jgi:dihydrofolate synthase/folylpolyglutamate synthase